MVKNNSNDLRINGIGKSTGGTFDFVQINGKGDINGDLECARMEVNGLGTFRGNVKSGSTHVSGKSNFAGDLEGKEILIDGMSEITGGLTAESVENRGMIKVSRDCGSDRFTSRGGFNIGGLLNAGEIEIYIFGPCTAREIGGERIEVRDGGPYGIGKVIGPLVVGTFFAGWPRKAILTADTIEGDDIYLECTIAKTVRGQNVTIGKNCEIDLVEYKGAFHTEGSSDITVKESRKI